MAKLTKGTQVRILSGKGETAEMFIGKTGVIVGKCGLYPGAFTVKISEPNTDWFVSYYSDELSPIAPKVMNITWKQSETSGYVGIDEDGNKYSMPANRETVTCRTKDGFTGYGWTAEEALELALAEREQVLDNHNKMLEEMKGYGEI